MANQTPEWKSFELAVTQFVSAIASDARVTHDVKIPDAHTGFPRQRDVWVEWSIGGHFPVRALISCKYWSKKLDQKDIDHFNGEFISASAHVGIIYARTGFNNRAVEKARELGFHACKLYIDAPADLPQQLSLGLAYHIAPRFSLSLSDQPSTQLATWNDVLDLQVEQRPIREILIEILEHYQDDGNPIERWNRARNGQSLAIDLPGDSRNRLGIQVGDRVRRAKVDYTLLNGSYNFTSNEFLGSQATPWIDTQNVDPGYGWEEVTGLPEQIPPIACYMHCDSTKAVEEFGAKSLVVTA